MRLGHRARPSCRSSQILIGSKIIKRPQAKPGAHMRVYEPWGKPGTTCGRKMSRYPHIATAWPYTPDATPTVIAASCEACREARRHVAVVSLGERTHSSALPTVWPWASLYLGTYVEVQRKPTLAQLQEGNSLWTARIPSEDCRGTSVAPSICHNNPRMMSGFQRPATYSWHLIALPKVFARPESATSRSPMLVKVLGV